MRFFSGGDHRYSFVWRGPRSGRFTSVHLPHPASMKSLMPFCISGRRPRWRRPSQGRRPTQIRRTCASCFGATPFKEARTPRNFGAWAHGFSMDERADAAWYVCQRESRRSHL